MNATTKDTTTTFHSTRGDVCKEVPKESPNKEEALEYNELPPPPCSCRIPNKLLPHGIHVALPPCTFGPPTARPSPSGRLLGLMIRRGPSRDDPFFAAYMECTKENENENKNKNSTTTAGRGAKKARKETVFRGFGVLSCKRYDVVCGVPKDGVQAAVPPPKLPPLPARERFLERRRRQQEVVYIRVVPRPP